MPAGWVPSGLLLTSYPLAGYILADWLAGWLYKLVIDLLPPGWLAGRPLSDAFLKNTIVVFYSKRAPNPAKTEVWHEKFKTVLPIVILKFIISIPNFTKF